MGTSVDGHTGTTGHPMSLDVQQDHLVSFTAQKSTSLRSSASFNSHERLANVPNIQRSNIGPLSRIHEHHRPCDATLHLPGLSCHKYIRLRSSIRVQRVAQNERFLAAPRGVGEGDWHCV